MLACSTMSTTAVLSGIQTRTAVVNVDGSLTNDDCAPYVADSEIKLTTFYAESSDVDVFNFSFLHY